MKMAIGMTQTHIAKGNVQTTNVATKRQLPSAFALFAETALGQVRECQGPGAAGLKDHCKRTFHLFWGDKNPGPSGAMRAGHFSPRGDIMLGISASPALY
jgi:hypothetical protein